jgi:hypothetical protein
MPDCFYFQVTLEPHLKHSGAKTGRKILILVAVPREQAISAGGNVEDELSLCETARRLAGELAPVAMTGRLRAPGEDLMTVSSQLYHPTRDMLERVPDAEQSGARAWLLGSDLA